MDQVIVIMTTTPAVEGAENGLRQLAVPAVVHTACSDASGR